MKLWGSVCGSVNVYVGCVQISVIQSTGGDTPLLLQTGPFRLSASKTVTPGSFSGMPPSFCSLGSSSCWPVSHSGRSFLQGINEHVNFNNFGNAIIVLIRTSTLDNWFEILIDAQVSMKGLASAHTSPHLSHIFPHFSIPACADDARKQRVLVQYWKLWYDCGDPVLHNIHPHRLHHPVSNVEGWSG